MIAASTIKERDITPLFEATGISPTGQTVTITETPAMYPYKEMLRDNWVYFSAFGYRRLKEILKKERCALSSLAIVGVGSGIDGIMASKVFAPTLRRLIITDIDEGILSGAVDNIRRNTDTSHEHELIPLAGSFCEPLVDAGYEADVVFGNVPNLASPHERLVTGAEKGTFMPSQLFNNYNPPEKFVQWALGSQYAFLQSAQEVIAENGSVVTELGGRVPLTLVAEVFQSCGLSLHEILVGFKEQTEAYEDFVGYHELERRHGVRFEFYRNQESIEFLHTHAITNPTSHMSGDEVKKLLQPFQVTAGEALNLFHQGVPVGHTVHLLRGIPVT